MSSQSCTLHLPSIVGEVPKESHLPRNDAEHLHLSLPEEASVTPEQATLNVRSNPGQEHSQGFYSSLNSDSLGSLTGHLTATLQLQNACSRTEEEDFQAMPMFYRTDSGARQDREQISPNALVSSQAARLTAF